MKLLITSILVVLSFGTIAQEVKTHIWYNTFEISPSFTGTYLNRPVETSYSGTMKSRHGNFNGSVGFSFVRSGKKNLHLETGIYLARRGFSYFDDERLWYTDKYGTILSDDTTRTWYREFEHYFRVPIGLQLNIPIKKGELFFKTGVAANLTLFREKKVLETSGTEPIYSGFGTGSQKRSNDFFVGADAYLKFGYSFPIAKKYNLSISSYFSHNISAFTGHTYATGLTVGLTKQFAVEKSSDNPPKSDRNLEAKNSIYIEGLGAGVIWSLNYERRLYAGKWFDFDARIGFSHSPRISTIPWIFPLSLSASFGKSINKFELLCGYGTVLSGGQLSPETVNAHLGYRLDSNNLIFFRAALGGLYFLQGGGFVPDAAIAIGRRF